MGVCARRDLRCGGKPYRTGVCARRVNRIPRARGGRFQPSSSIPVRPWCGIGDRGFQNEAPSRQCRAVQCSNAGAALLCDRRCAATMPSKACNAKRPRDREAVCGAAGGKRARGASRSCAAAPFARCVCSDATRLARSTDLTLNFPRLKASRAGPASSY